MSSLSGGDQLGVAAGCLTIMFLLFVGLAELCDEVGTSGWVLPSIHPSTNSRLPP